MRSQFVAKLRWETSAYGVMLRLGDSKPSTHKLEEVEETSTYSSRLSHTVHTARSPTKRYQGDFHNHYKIVRPWCLITCSIKVICWGRRCRPKPANYPLLSTTSDETSKRRIAAVPGGVLFLGGTQSIALYSLCW